MPVKSQNINRRIISARLAVLLSRLFKKDNVLKIDGDPSTVFDGDETMEASLVALVQTSAADAKQNFRHEMDAFMQLYRRFKSGGSELEWDRLMSPNSDQILVYESLKCHDRKGSLLSKLAVLKVNGGLGTSMGLSGAKSALEIKDGLSFLDLTVLQMRHLNESSHAEVPLLLMNSFNTDADTSRIVHKYADSGVRIETCAQSRCPRIFKESLLPCPTSAQSDKTMWYPPGHGDLYQSLKRSGTLDRLLQEGKEYLFVSNADNLGATVDERILQHMEASHSEFIMEVTDKTKADVKGGTLVQYDGSIQLLELAQVPKDHVHDFKSVQRFKVFNTNNLWIDLRALKRRLDQGALKLDVIVNSRTLPDGQAILQLETAAGAAIKYFHNALGIKVPRSRFLPVKHCSDLLLLRSDLYTLEHGRLILNPQRQFGTAPTVTLSEHFSKIERFQARFQGIPRIMELDHLSVSGDVHFGRDVTLKGTVIVVAKEGQRIDVPDGCLLENKMLTGDVTMTEL